MITLTGPTSDSSVTLTAGQRYVFQWVSDTINGPSAGNIVVAHKWNDDAVPSFRNASGTAYSYDLSAVLSGGFEFTAAYSGLFLIDVSGSGGGDIVHFAVTPIL